MHILKTCLLSVFLLAMFLCGCSQTNEEDVQKAKRFEALKGLPLDTVLTRAYKFYEQFQATGDTLQRDSMNDYRDHFFARWKLSSDSLCGTVPADDSLAAELRDIYEVVMTSYTKFLYWQTLDKAQQEAVLKKDSVLSRELTELKDLDSYLKKWRENQDSMLAVDRMRDSIRKAMIMDIPLEEAVSGLKKAYSIYDSIYFVQKMRVFYVDTSASDMNEMDKIDMLEVRRNKMKEAKLACMGKTPSGQKILILTEEYESLLKNSMDAKIDWENRDRSLLLKIQYFWHPKIFVVPHFWGGFIFESAPIISKAVFNKTHDLVIVDVSDGDQGWNYYLSKKNGKWELVMHKDGWVA